MEQISLAKFKGLYMYKYNDQIKYIRRVKGDYDFNQRINAGYASISPKNCYIDGQATNCHINSIIKKMGDQVRFYIMPLESDLEICLLESKLIKQHQPEWNIVTIKIVQYSLKINSIYSILLKFLHHIFRIFFLRIR